MTRFDGLRSIVLGCAALAIGACSGSGGGSAPAAASGVAGGPTRLSVSLIDAPVDDVAEVNVEITAIRVKPADGGPAFELPLTDSPMTVNLLGLTDENAAILIDNALIEAGNYEWLAMDVNAEIDGVTDSYVVTKTGEWDEIRVPSGRVRLVDGFEVTANQATKLIFDWDMRKGLVSPPGQGGKNQKTYLLKPAFRVIGVSEYGRLSGAIGVDTVALEDNACADDDADLDVGNSVYVFEGLGITADDIDGADPEPLTTLDAVLRDDSTEYDYSTLLPFGDYTVAFTCQAANDAAETSETGNEDPADDTVSFFAPVGVTLDADQTDAVVDF